MRKLTQTFAKFSLALGAILLPGLIILPSQSAFAQSQDAHYYCDGYAREYAERNSSGGALRGAGRGAAGGAIFGAIAGDAGVGAAAGAAVGALGGGIRKSETTESLYKQAYNDCISRYR